MDQLPRPSYTFLGLLFLLGPVLVQADCGSITYRDWSDFEQVTFIEEVIVDCDNPFATDAVVGYTPQLFINNTEVFDGDVVETTASQPVLLEHSIDPPDYGSFYNVDIYQQTPSGYQQINHTSDDNLLDELPSGVYVAVYIPYTMTQQMLNPPTWRDRFKQLVLPNTAYAFSGYGDFAEVATLRFTVVQKSQEPTGASSVLFLPGIQASRLYKENVIGREDLLWEPSLNFGQDVTQLAFNSNRESINAIYTKEEDIIDTANFVPGLSFDDFVVYETWIDRLNEEKVNNTIADWYALAYDWRFDVFDVVRDGIQTGPANNRAVIRPLVALEKLADAAPNNKVSIVAHSNGGLLAKAMLIEADRLCRENPGGPCLIDRVDQLILLGSPQIGTPESLKGLLHGDENNIKTYPAIPAADVRAVAQTLPGTHALLPSEEYLSGLGFSTISFIGSGPDFERFRTVYPDGVRTSEQLQAFLRGAEGRDNPDFGDVYRPGILDQQLVETGAESIKLLSDWIVPESITVTEIVGVGAHTISRLRYDSFEETRRSLSGVQFVIDRTTVRFGTTLYGDQTVMARSAEAYEGEKETYYFDLQIYNEFAAEEGSGLLPANHANLTEPSDIQDLLISLVSSSSAPISDYISQTLPQYENERYDGLSTFSPVDLLIEDVDGNRTGLLRNEDGIGRIVEEIPNSRFFMIGSSSHLYVPSDTEYDVRISGYQEGSYSLVIEEIIEGLPPQEITRFENATVTPIMLVTLNKTDGLFSQITTDYNADGIIDEVRKSDGEVVVVVAEDSSQEVPLTNPEIEVEPPTVVERIAGSSSSATRINRSILVGQVAGITTSNMTEVEQLEELTRLLTRLSELLTLLYKI